MNGIKGYGLLPAAIVLMCIPELVQAYQLSPNPNPIDSTIEINTNDVAENFVEFINDGSVRMDEDSTLNNFGVLKNAASFIGCYCDSTLNNYGTLENSGSMAPGYFSHMNNTGTISNLASATLSTGTLFNQYGGTLNNNGEMTIFRSLNNAGSINNSGFNLIFAASLSNTGILNNSGILDIHHSSFYNAGTLNNSGGITNDAYAVNTGAITGNGTYGQIYLDSKTINNGTITQSAVNIYDGSLSGSGTINGNVSIGFYGSLNPGNSIGSSVINGDFSSNGNVDFELGGLGAGQYDVLQINGDATFIGGNLVFDLVNGFQAADGDSFDFLLAHNVTGLNTLGFTINGLGAGLAGRLVRENGGLGLLITAVPEPETYSMLVAGLSMIGFMTQRRKIALTA